MTAPARPLPPPPDPAPDSTVLVEGLGVVTPSGVTLLEETGFSLSAGEVLLIIGPSGSGKTSLISLLAGLICNGRDGWSIGGTIRYGDRSVDLAAQAADVAAVVFQDDALFDDLTAAENLEIAADHARRGDAALMRQALGLLADIPPDQAVAACSGGQRQRLAIARTLLANRPVVVFDEPNAGLDAVASRRLADIIRTLARRMGRPVVVVAHHLSDLLPIADRVLLLDRSARCLRPLPRDRRLIEADLHALEPEAADAADPAGAGGPAAGAETAETRWPAELGSRSRLAWWGRYFAEYLWTLSISPLMLAYVALGGLVSGFVAMWFGFNDTSIGGYLRALAQEEILAGVGLAMNGIGVPLLVGILVAARNTAIVAADLGNRVRSGQFKAMANLGIPARAYIAGSIFVNMAAGSLVLLAAALAATGWAARETWGFMFPHLPYELWHRQFYRVVLGRPELVWETLGWASVKVVLGGMAASAIAIAIGMRPKRSVIDINRGVAVAIVAGVSATLLIHAAISVIVGIP